MKVGYVEPLDPVPFLPTTTAVSTNTDVGPYGLLTVTNPGSLVYTPPNGSSRTLRRVTSGEIALSFKRIDSAGTTASGFAGRNVSILQRTLIPFNPFVLTDWPAGREAKLPALARRGRIYRDNFGLFHSDIVGNDVLPLGWESWQVIYVDPIHGRDNDAMSGYDGTTMAKAYRNLYKAIASGTNPACVVVPDGAIFGFGDEPSTAALNLWPISKTSNQAPTKSFVIMPLSAYTSGEPSGDWTSTTELRVGWTADTTVSGDPVVRGTLTGYSPAITGADLSGWAANQSGAVFDLGPGMMDEFGFGSRYKAVALNASSLNVFEYTVENSTNILVRLPTSLDATRAAYATEYLKLFANWIQGRIRNNANSQTCYMAGKLLGGTPFRGSFGIASTTLFEVSAYRSIFAYSADTANGFKFDGSIMGITARCTLVQCTSAQNGGDGFGYYYDIGALEVNCFATANGSVYPPTYIGEAGTATDNQAFTTHTHCTVLRVACWGTRSRGPNYQDTNFAGNSDGTRVIMLGCYGGESSARDGSRFPCDIMVGEDTAADPNTWVWLVNFKYATPYGVPSLYTANRRPAGMAAMIQGARIYTTDGSVPTPYPTGLAVNTTVIGINI